MMNPIDTMIAQFAEKIMEWKNIEEIVTPEGPKLIGDVETADGSIFHGEVPNYYEDAIALWASGSYINNKGLVLEFIQSIKELTGAGDLTDPNEIFKLVFAAPQIVIQAAVQAYDKAQSYKPN